MEYWRFDMFQSPSNPDKGGDTVTLQIVDGLVHCKPIAFGVAVCLSDSWTEVLVSNPQWSCLFDHE